MNCYVFFQIARRFKIGACEDLALGLFKKEVFCKNMCSL